MKTKIALSVILAAAATFALIDRPLAAPDTASAKPELALPLDLECVVTIENQAWMANLPTQSPGPASGFRADFTVQGKLIQINPDWVVIKDGTYENWISRDKVLNIRASR
ncbi:MAG TPA: hypothetical protein VF258_00130 [Luteolibacter sp.]